MTVGVAYASATNQCAPAARQRPGAGTEGGPSMQWQPSADRRLPSGNVCGLGVCDALRVELAPAQLFWLIDELEEMRTPLEEEWQRLGAALVDTDDVETRRDLEALDYRLRLLRMMRAQLPGIHTTDTTTLVGPTAMVLEVVEGAMGSAVDALSAWVNRTTSEPMTLDELVGAADAARAWVDTYVECRAVERFRFDPDADPPRAD